MDEIWRPVLGYEGHYEVSNFGQVRSVDRVALKNNVGGSGNLATQPGKLIAQTFSRYGYPRVHLSKEGVKSKIRVYTLVCEAFHGPRPEGAIATLRDGNPANCREANVQWTTRKEGAALRTMRRQQRMAA